MSDTSWSTIGDVLWHEVPREDAGDVARAVMDTVRGVEARQFSIHEGNRRHARMYAGYLPVGMSWVQGPGGNQRTPFTATKAVVRGVCDTATALVSKFRPKATIVTNGANWKVAQQADDLDRFMVGAYEQSGIYRASSMSFHDSTVFGTGLWKFVERGRGESWKVSAERVLPDNFVVDEDECPEEPFEPANTYHRTLVDTRALLAKYGDGDQGLKLLIQSSSARSWPGRSVPGGKSVLVEAIHVDRDGGPGRRVLTTDGAVLADEVWPFAWHPYEFLWWHLPVSGFYGDGVAYRQYGLQERVSYLYRWLEKVHNLFGNPVAWVDPAGGPIETQMSNEVGAIVRARRPPVFQPRQMVSHEVYAWIDKLIHGGFEDEGMNQATAGNLLPPGVESAPAQREFSFKESNRFAPVSQRWETALAVGSCRKMAAMCARHYKRGGRPKAKWADRKLMHEIDWPNIDEDAYLIRSEASSLDTLAPHARIQSAIELSQTNWLTPAEGRELMGHPDLQEADELDNAPRTYAKKVLYDMLHGEVVEVDKFANLTVLDDVIRRGRLLAKQRNAPAKLVDSLSDFLERLDEVTRTAAAAQAAQVPPQGAQGPAGPIGQAAAEGSPPPFPAR